MSKKTTVLMIMDGFGINEKEEANAIKQASTKNLDFLMENYPNAQALASGLAVGLPDGQMGNSEVGHLNIGAGRIVYQELTRITKSIQDGDFFENKELLSAIENCKKNNSDLHLYGLLSDGGVHSHISHLYAMLEMAKRNDFTNVFVHAFLDGRDTAPSSGKTFVENLEAKMSEIGVGKIATVMGRYYAMDRDNRFERVQKAYDAMVLAEGERSSNALECIIKSHEANILDEFVVPTVITDNDKPVAVIKENDSIVFFNFRPDRAREISRAFCDENFSEFERKFMKLTYVCFTEYDITIPNKSVAFKPQTLANTLGEYIAGRGLKQLRLAETEKYAHVTFFFNGGVEAPSEGEERILIQSPKVATYDLQPEMSAKEVTEKLVENILSNKYDLIIINYANPDMVGHTGVISAAVKAVEAVDAGIGKVFEALKTAGGQMLICADHGNSDQMINYETGEAFTAHTTNPVPLIMIDGPEGAKLKGDGCLADIAPTLLDMMDIPQPPEMTGKSLLIR